MTTKDATKTEPRSAQETMTSDRFFGEMRTGRLETTSRPKEGVDHDSVEHEEPPNRRQPPIDLGRNRTRTRPIEIGGGSSLTGHLKAQLMFPRGHLARPRCIVREPQQRAKFRVELGQRELCRGFSRDHDEIDVLVELPATLAKPGANPALEEISHHSVSDLPARRDAQPRSERLGRPQTIEIIGTFSSFGRYHDKLAVGAPTPSTQNATKIPRIEESIRPSKTAGLFAHDLFGRDGRSESFPTLCSAALQDCTPRLRLHPFSKAVLPETLDPARLKCPLHRCGSSLRLIDFG